jgi:hypothetical protein
MAPLQGLHRLKVQSAGCVGLREFLLVSVIFGSRRFEVTHQLLGQEERGLWRSEIM